MNINEVLEAVDVLKRYCDDHRSDDPQIGCSKCYFFKWNKDCRIPEFTIKEMENSDGK